MLQSTGISHREIRHDRLQFQKSFAGIPPDVPSWGNIVAEGRERIFIAFHIVAFPGLFLTITVLAVNLMGDGLRDSLDPRMRRRL